MSQELFSAALGQLNERYIEEALQYRRARKNGVWVRLGAAAACFAVALAAALSAWGGPTKTPPPGLPPAVSSDSLPARPDASDAPADPEALHIDMSGIFVNKDLSEPMYAARLYYDPALYDEVLWDRDAVIHYLGRDLTPSYVPAGLTAFDGNGTARAEIRKENGEIVWDAVYYRFYQVFGTWDDGTPRTIDENAVSHGFTLSASRIGLFNCGIVYLGSEDEVKTSDIAGVPVTIGYRAMPYGPYHPETHEPAGYYDLYVAEFELDGIQLQLVADEMELEDVIKIIASVLCPGQEIELEP